jgi:hypothetical protein
LNKACLSCQIAEVGSADEQNAEGGRRPRGLREDLRRFRCGNVGRDADRLRLKIAVHWRDATDFSPVVDAMETSSASELSDQYHPTSGPTIRNTGHTYTALSATSRFVCADPSGGGGFRREVQPRRQHWFLNEKSGFPFRTPAFCSASRGQSRLGEKEYRAPSVTPGVALRPRTQGWPKLGRRQIEATPLRTREIVVWHEATFPRSE